MSCEKGKRQMTEGRKFVDRLTAVPLKNRFLSIVLCVCLLIGLVPMQAAAVTPGSTQINEKIEGEFIKAWKNGKTSFNINGVDGSKTYQTTFMNRGYGTAVSVDGGTKQSNPSNLIASGLRLDVDLSLYGDNYVMVQYTLTNDGAKSHDVQVGSYADVMIDRNDRAPMYAETGGGDILNMSGSPKNNYGFKLVATGCDTLWYGFYGDRFEECFTNMTDRGPSNKYKGDSALAYSWKTVVAPGETWTRCVLIGTGSLAQMNAEAPSVPTPAELIPDPAISLSTGEIYVTEGDSLPNWKSYITRLVGTVSTSGAPTNTNTTGTYTVTYTAANNDKTAKATLKVNILPRAAELSKTTPTTQTSGFALSATMNYTGGLKWTETGFVYGVVTKPTLTQNDGTVKTSSAISSKGGKLTATVKKSSLVRGLQYYARAYAKTADGTIIYGESSTRFGVGVPKYGSFSVTNNNSNEFTISRTNGSDGAQTVYYRTVNGSAVGGTHFEHTYGKLEFADGETSKTVTVKENAVTSIYKESNRNYPATAYSNADRVYFMEIARVEGGAEIGTSRATRTMPKSSSYTVDKSIYKETSRSIKISNDNKWVGDHSNCDNWDIYFKNDRYDDTKGNIINFNASRSLDVSSSAKSYLKETAGGFLYKSNFTYKEKEDGYQLAWIGNHVPGDGPSRITNKSIPLNDSVFGEAYFTATWETKDKTEGTVNLPSITTGANVTNVNAKKVNSEKIIGDYILFGVDETAYAWFSSAGANKDIWYMNSYTDYVKVHDVVEPQIIGVKSNSQYSILLPGDKLTISIIFDEIVDEANSKAAGLSEKSYVTVKSYSSPYTDWGKFYYEGGAGTNVLYFTGTVPEGAKGYTQIEVTDLNCASHIKDMSDDTGTLADRNNKIISANLTLVNVTSAAAPTVSVGSITNKNGTLSSTITATNAAKLEYAWSNSSKTPTYGWTTASSTSSVSVKTVRAAGTYYLHARATNSDGIVETAYKSVTVPPSGTNAQITPELTVSAANSSWAKTQNIKVTRSPSGAAVTVKTPSGTTTTLGSTATSYTATANGVYTFTLTYNGETVTRQATVNKIDTTAPTVIINDLPSDSYTERITLTFSVADSASGVKSVSAKWGSTAVDVTKNSDGTYSVTCPDATGTYKLTVTAADTVGNSTSKTSKSYKVNLTAPTLTVTEKTKTKTGVTYSYTVNANGNSDVLVHLPDGTETDVLDGTFTLTEAGDYVVTVTDEAGHFVSENIGVTENVDGVAPDVRLSADDTADTASLNIQVVIYEAKALSAVKKDGTALSFTDNGGGEYTASFTVTKGGEYTVTAVDSAGNQGKGVITVYALQNDGSTALKLADDGKYCELPTPSKAGYRFDGWYTAASGGTKADNGTAVGSNYTLYAHWTHIDHSGGTATCKDKAVCAVCGAEYGEIDSNNHDIVHYGAKAATCTEDGWNAYDACSRCDYTTIKVIPALNHDFENGVWLYDGTQHWKKCSRCDENDTAKSNHTFGKWENGKRSCGICGYEEASTVSVTITWSAMDFTYSDGTWNAKNHKYENSGWKPTQTNGNLITVKNDGKSSINVTCNYTQKNTAISGSFSDGGAILNAPFALPSGSQKDLLLILSGKPAAAMNKSEIGEVTVRIGG